MWDESKEIQHLDVAVLLWGDAAGAHGGDGHKAVQLGAVFLEERQGVMAAHRRAQ